MEDIELKERFIDEKNRNRIYGEEYAVFSIKRKIYYKPKEKSTDFINKK